MYIPLRERVHIPPNLPNSFGSKHRLKSVGFARGFKRDSSQVRYFGRPGFRGKAEIRWLVNQRLESRMVGKESLDSVKMAWERLGKMVKKLVENDLRLGNYGNNKISEMYFCYQIRSPAAVVSSCFLLGNMNFVTPR